jgi:hypothetical protein
MSPTLVLKARELAKHAKRIATHCGCHVVSHRVSNPTLVAHGLVKASSWHILTHEPPRKAVADLYVPQRATAIRIARLLANLLDVQLDVLDNTATPADLKAHPKNMIEPTAKFAMNPKRRKYPSRKVRRALARLKGSGTSAEPRALYYARMHRMRKSRAVSRAALRANPKGRNPRRKDRPGNDRDFAIDTIKAALKKRSGKTWSVTPGRGTAWGWIHIDVPPSKRTWHHERPPGTPDIPESYILEVNTGKPGGGMGPIRRAELARLLGLDEVHWQGVSIPAASDYYDEYMDRAQGRVPERIGKPYWDNPSRTKTARGRRSRRVLSHRQRRSLAKAGFQKSAQTRYQIISQIRRGTARGLPHGRASNPKPTTIREAVALVLHEAKFPQLVKDVRSGKADPLAALELARKFMHNEAQRAMIDRAIRIVRAQSRAPNPKRRNPGGARIVYNRLLGGWYVVVGPHQTPLNGRFNSKAEAQAWLFGRRANPSRSSAARGTRQRQGLRYIGRKIRRAKAAGDPARLAHLEHRQFVRSLARSREWNPEFKFDWKRGKALSLGRRTFEGWRAATSLGDYYVTPQRAQTHAQVMAGSTDRPKGKLLGYTVQLNSNAVLENGYHWKDVGSFGPRELAKAKRAAHDDFLVRVLNYREPNPKGRKSAAIGHYYLDAQNKMHGPFKTMAERDRRVVAEIGTWDDDFLLNLANNAGARMIRTAARRELERRGIRLGHGPFGGKTGLIRNPKGHFTPSRAAVNRAIDALLERAQTAFEAGRKAEAQTLYERAWSLAPTPNRRTRNPGSRKPTTYDSSGARHQGLASEAQAIYAEAGLQRLGIRTRGVEKRGKRWHVIVQNPIPRGIDARSIRTVMAGAKRILVGCPAGQYRPRARGRKCATGMRRVNPRDPAAESKAGETVRMFQDRGPVPLTKKRMRKPPALKETAAELGKLVGVVYRSDKFDGKVKDYEHDFSKPLPSLVTDPDGKGLHIVGGGYKITPDGIVN